MTIIAGLEVVDSALGTRSQLTINLIGVAERELDALNLFEDLFHLLPNLKTLHCAFVGPEVPCHTEDGETIVIKYCESCTLQGRQGTAMMWKGTYDDFVKTERYLKPDIAVVFHSEHWDKYNFNYEGWLFTLKLLVKADYPTIFTWYVTLTLVLCH